MVRISFTVVGEIFVVEDWQCQQVPRDGDIVELDQWPFTVHKCRWHSPTRVTLFVRRGLGRFDDSKEGK